MQVRIHSPQRRGIANSTVEKRADGWYFSRSANRYNSSDWKGPYSSVESVAMTIAR